MLSSAAITALRAHRVRQLEERLVAGSAWQEQNLVFTNTKGGIYDPSNLVSEFHKALQRAELPKINFHKLRHTCASLLISQGVHMRVIQDLLGHSDFYLTMNTYSHVIPEQKREAADKMDRLLASGDK